MRWLCATCHPSSKTNADTKKFGLPLDPIAMLCCVGLVDADVEMGSIEALRW